MPLDEGDRVVSLMNWDASTSNREQRLLHDFAAWRAMTSIDDLGITRTVQRNLIATAGQPEVVTVAEISAAAFRVARVPALRGRFLLPEDERAGAPDAIVIGHDEWVRRFDADPDIVGRSVQLGSDDLRHRRRDAGGLRVPAQPRLLDPVAASTRPPTSRAAVRA